MKRPLKIVLGIFGVILLIGIVASFMDSAEPTSAPAPAPATATSVIVPTPSTVDDPCQPHVELHNAAFWSKELGRPEIVVLQQHRINLWSGQAPTKGRKVGELRVGSRALILETGPEDHRVRSPLDRSIGWVGKIQVARTLHQHIETREPCEPNAERNE